MKKAKIVVMDADGSHPGAEFDHIENRYLVVQSLTWMLSTHEIVRYHTIFISANLFCAPDPIVLT